MKCVWYRVDLVVVHGRDRSRRLCCRLPPWNSDCHILAMHSCTIATRLRLPWCTLGCRTVRVVFAIRDTAVMSQYIRRQYRSTPPFVHRTYMYGMCDNMHVPKQRVYVPRRRNLAVDLCTLGTGTGTGTGAGYNVCLHHGKKPRACYCKLAECRRPRKGYFRSEAFLRALCARRRA